MSDDDILKKVLQGINDTLESINRDTNEFHLVPFMYIAFELEKFTRDIDAEKGIPIPKAYILALHQLNVEQNRDFDMIFCKAINGEGGMFFVDGPGGTRKNFLYKVLLDYVRLRGDISLVVASSSIASSGFLGGRTMHYRFQIPIDVGGKIKCNIDFKSIKANLIRSSKIIIGDKSIIVDKETILAGN